MAQGEREKPAERERLRTKAVESLAKRLKSEKVEVVAEESDTVASSKETLVRFVGRPADDPNGPHFAVVLDSAGREVDLPKLERAEGRAFFPGPALDVDITKLLPPDKVVTIDPKVNDIQLSECGFREKITVSIPAQPIREKVDVYFLADNTGSMGLAIANVQAGAGAIMSALGGLD